MQKHEPIVEGTHSLFGLQNLTKTLGKKKNLKKNIWKTLDKKHLTKTQTRKVSLVSNTNLFQTFLEWKTIAYNKKKIISFFISKSNKLFKIIGLIVKSFVTDPQQITKILHNSNEINLRN